MAFYWSPVENILSLWRSVGRPWGILSVYGVLLVTHGEYSQSQAFYWSPVGNILSVSLTGLPGLPPPFSQFPRSSRTSWRTTL
eukprot:4092089-Pyramimonas_sp.AAC.1